MKTDDEVIHETFGSRTDIFSYNVYKMDWGTHSYFTFLLSIEDGLILHLFDIGFNSERHLKFKPELIYPYKKMLVLIKTI